MSEVWKQLNHYLIADGYQLSTYGRIRYKDNDPYEPEYHSTNGYDYSLFVLKKEFHENGMTSRLFPIDDLIGLTFLTSSTTLRDVRVKINHIDGNNRNNNLYNLEWIEDKEEWRPLIAEVITKEGDVARVPKDEYMISSWCRIYSLKNETFLMPHLDDGYVKIALPFIIDRTGARIRKNTKIHRMMGMTFDLPKPDDKHDCINHINGNRQDNSIKNLEWVTYQQNVKHAFMTGLEINPKGQAHPRAKFTNHQRECIYEILKTMKHVQPKVLTKIIAERLPNISHDDVKYAKQVIRKTQGFEFPKLACITDPNFAKLTEEEINEIRSQVYEIFDKYGITKVEVYENEYKKKC